MRPFLKWAGGKTRLLPQLGRFFPLELRGGNIRKYVEPFLGGGAMFFHIVCHYLVEEFYLIDINPELINTYRILRKDVEPLIDYLSIMECEFKELGEEERKEYYYNVRSQFNKTTPLLDSLTLLERAAQLIFLNHTCFNGLFRVNSKRQFNVPIGRYKNPVICDKDNLRAVAKVLKGVKINCGDFSQCESLVDEDTFVYLDPPYRPISKTANFTAYSKECFKDEQQLQLRDFFVRLHARGAKLMLSNSHTNDCFFQKEYTGYQIQEVSASRLINSNVRRRGKVPELVITNYHIG